MKNSQTQEAFFKQIAPNDQFFRLLDLLPDVSFFIKDRDGKFMAASMNKNEHFGLIHEGNSIGKTDHDFFSAQRADAYRADDLCVMENGEPLVNRMEAAPETHGSPRLVLTTKIPLHNRKGKIIGVAGFSRPINQAADSTQNADDQLRKAIDCIYNNFGDSLTSEKLATLAGLSVSQFERRFREAFGTTPRQYLMRVRLEAAAKKLAGTRNTVSEIAIECGFADHAHFSRQFRKSMDLSPTEYRARYLPA